MTRDSMRKTGSVVLVAALAMLVLATTGAAQTVPNGDCELGTWGAPSVSPDTVKLTNWTWVSSSTPIGNWRIGTTSTTPHAGGTGTKSAGAAHTGTSKQCQYKQVLTGLATDKTYSVSAWLKASDSSAKVTLGAGSNTGPHVWSPNYSGTDWSQFTVTPISPNANGEIDIVIDIQNGTLGGTTRISFFDDVTITVNCTAPNIPGTPTVGNVTSNSATVANNAGDSDTAYFAFRVNGSQYVQADGTLGANAVWQLKATWGTKLVTGLLPATTYTIDVLAAATPNGGCATDPSTAVEITTDSDCVPPEAPSNATASEQSICNGNSTVLSATPGNGGNEVWWFTGSCGGTPVGTGAGNQTVSPTTNTTYYAKTKISSFECWSETCATVTVTVVNGVPAAPAAEAATVGTASITWNWSAIPEAASYTLWDAPSAGNQIGGTISTNSYEETGLTPGVTYTRYIEAVNACGVSTTRTELTATTNERFCLDNPGFDSFIAGLATNWKSIITIPNGGTVTFAQGLGKDNLGTGQKITWGKASQEAFVYQSYQVRAGAVYKVGVWVSSTHTACRAELRYDANGGSTPVGFANLVADPQGSSVWHQLSANTPARNENGSATIFVGGYGTSNGANQSISLDDVTVAPADPTSASASPNMLCESVMSSSVELTLAGGFGLADYVKWYSDPECTNEVATGNPANIDPPTSTTTYYGRYEDSSLCTPNSMTQSVTITVDTDTDSDGVCDSQDGCPDNPEKAAPGTCGCDVADEDTDSDGVADCIDNCPNDPNPEQEDADSNGIGDVCETCEDMDSDGVCGGADNCPDVANPDQEDADSDGVGDACDNCPEDPNKTEPGDCGCGVADEDSDSDGTLDCNDGCPNDPNKVAPGDCGCGVADDDSDSDGTADCIDSCPDDPNKIAGGVCGCGVADNDSDSDGTPDCNDGCPDDPNKTAEGQCGCGVADDDSDNDGTADCKDLCPDDPTKSTPGVCGCNQSEDDSDSDGTPDCNDQCPNDPDKIAPGTCGCEAADVDSDSDGTLDCEDGCPNDPNKTAEGQCGCGIADDDSDSDGTADCKDGCPIDPNKVASGVCGCGVADDDSDSDGTADCNDQCPLDPNKIAPGECDCGVQDTDSDSDGTADCIDGCPDDPNKIIPGTCGCGVADDDSDSDGTADCNDQCPDDPNKIVPGECGCGTVDADADSDGVLACNDCDDNDATVYPGATELADGKDNDCDGQVDEGLAQIVARSIFYNNSYYDNNNVGIDAGTGVKTDSAAIDTSKSPLMVGGGTCTFANWTGYNKGINGLIYDIEAPSRDPQASDFTFTNLGRLGTGSTPINPSASSIIVLQASAPRKVRIVFTFADGAMKNGWLQVDVGIGFGAPTETHYWGNVVGDTGTGNTAPNILVTPADELAARSHTNSALNPSPVTDPYDIDKTHLVGPADQLVIRSNNTTSLNGVKYITR